MKILSHKNCLKARSYWQWWEEKSILIFLYYIRKLNYRELIGKKMIKYQSNKTRIFWWNLILCLFPKMKGANKIELPRQIIALITYNRKIIIVLIWGFFFLCSLYLFLDWYHMIFDTRETDIILISFLFDDFDNIVFRNA